ncbi:MAG: translation elongation factor Ts [Chloroflexota bacterium]
MANITAQMVKELRQATGAGILETKKALEATDGNFDKAVDLLREKGAARAAKRSGRDANEGLIKMYSHPGGRIGVMLELNCETDFVARNEQFQQLAHDLALQIAAMAPKYLNIEDVDQSELDRELEVLRNQALSEGKPEHIVEKIVSGRMSKFYEEICLVEQSFVKDDSKKIKDLVTETISVTGENIIIGRFARFEIGESAE